MGWDNGLRRTSGGEGAIQYRYLAVSQDSGMTYVQDRFDCMVCNQGGRYCTVGNHAESVPLNSLERAKGRGKGFLMNVCPSLLSPLLVQQHYESAVGGPSKQRANPTLHPIYFHATESTGALCSGGGPPRPSAEKWSEDELQ